ncbi:hypothetical protein FQR65_LT03331 [Abscondita terminalis]|nr:hypothetical protein FQR65_LT03331 [Abscondita terminalis]
MSRCQELRLEETNGLIPLGEKEEQVERMKEDDGKTGKRGEDENKNIKKAFDIKKTNRIRAKLRSTEQEMADGITLCFNTSGIEISLANLSRNDAIINQQPLYGNDATQDAS